MRFLHTQELHVHLVNSNKVCKHLPRKRPDRIYHLRKLNTQETNTYANKNICDVFKGKKSYVSNTDFKLKIQRWHILIIVSKIQGIVHISAIKCPIVNL